LFALVCLALSLRYLRRKRLIDDLPTSKAHGVFIGQCELKGTAESGTPFISYLAGRRCVYYRYTVEEHWSRTTVYMTNKGPQVKRESGWREVAQGEQSAPFYLKDETGFILITPEGADLFTTVVFEKECRRADPLYYGKGPSYATANSSHRRRFKETAILLHAPLYVTGHARERTDVVAPEVAADKNAHLFVISVQSEKQMGRWFLLWLWAWFALGLAGSLGLAYLYRSGWPSSPAPYVLVAGLYLAVYFLGWLATVFNSLIRLKNRVRQTWSQIDIQLKRRSDLIPRLVECLSGYRSYERGMQETIAELRSQAAAGSQVAHSLKGTLLAVGESYPELKASSQFLSLQAELAGTEERIALARSYYNDTVTFYNTRLAVIPDRWVAWLGGMKPGDIWHGGGFERNPPAARVEV
jgi:hypothetical protein